MAHALIDVDDSLLIVIDVQENFLARLGTEEHTLLLNRIGYLVDVAVRLGVPLVVTAEDIARNGGVAPQIAARLPSGTSVHDKMFFGLAGQPDIYQAVQGTGRRTAVLIGMETDVCVAQSAVGLLCAGYRVAVVADAVGSPGAAAHAAGLERMRQAGVIVSSVKGLFYEWIRTVPAMREFFTRYRREIDDPIGIVM